MIANHRGPVNTYAMEKIAIHRTENPKPKPDPKKLGFGQFFSDHMFVLEYGTDRGWHSPKILPYSSFSLDPAASVFHYGQALFEGGKAFFGADCKLRLFRPQYHCHRMGEGAQRLCMPPVPEDLMLQGLKELVKIDQDWIPREPGSALYLRPTLIGTEAFLGVRPSNTYKFFVITSPVGSYYAEGLSPVKIWVEDEYSRAAPGGLGATKAGANYAASLLAAMQAKQKGFSQVLWLDASTRKNVEEVGTMNVFFRIQDEIITPPLAGTILGGATRDCCLTLLKRWGLRVSERPLSIDEVMNAHQSHRLQEVFGTGTAAVITPVGELAYKGKSLTINNFKMGELSQRLYDTISGIQYGRLPDPDGWTVTL